MFKFLKEKLKNALNKFSKDVDQESNVVEETVKETVKELEQHADDVDVQDVPTNSVEGINAIDNNSKKQKKSGKSVFNEDEFGMHPDEFKRLQKEKEPEIEIKEPELFLKEKRKNLNLFKKKLKSSLLSCLKSPSWICLQNQMLMRKKLLN